MCKWISTDNSLKLDYQDESDNLSIYNFCDTSNLQLVFLQRIKRYQQFVLVLVSIAGVSPTKRICIVFFKLLAAHIGTRLFSLVKEDLRGVPQLCYHGYENKMNGAFKSTIE